MVDITTLIAAHTLVVAIIWILSVLPLYFAVRLVKGEAGMVKVIAISLILSFASIGAISFIGLYAGLFMLIATLFVYKIAFNISFLKAFIVWVLQYVFVFAGISLLIFLVRMSLS